MNVTFNTIADNDATPCSACSSRHREPTMYPSMLRTFDAFPCGQAEPSPEGRICRECRKARDAAEARYAGKINALMGDGDKELSVEDMAAIAACNEQCAAEYEQIAAEHEAKMKELRTA